MKFPPPTATDAATDALLVVRQAERDISSLARALFTFFENISGAGGPDQRCGAGMMNRQILFNRRDEIGFAMKHSAPDPVGGQGAPEAFHPVEPGRPGRGEVEMEAYIPLEPGLAFGVLVRGVVVADHMDLPIRQAPIASPDPESGSTPDAGASSYRCR